MWFDNLLTFIELGFRHILPLGLDHILFIVAIFLNARTWRSLLLQATCFTLAHTITLGLAAAGLIDAPEAIVEPLIALSIVVLAIEALVLKAPAAWRLPVIFAFGLFHGLGFGALMKLYLQGADFATGLAGFTIGVELGQLAVLAGAGVAALAMQTALKAANRPGLYPWVFTRPIALAIALLGSFWVLQRTGLIVGG